MNAPAKQYHEFTTPTGRMVGGNLYEPKKTDSEGRPLVFKNGDKKGEARVDFYCAIAIPKTPGVSHWASEKGWGEILWAAGHALGGSAAQRPDFAWKVTDGDSQVPNTKGKKPCDNEGFPGCWILHTGNGSAPKIVNSNGSAYLLEAGAVKAGYFIQLNASVNYNGSQSNPGVFINNRVVSLQYHGTEINFGADPTQMGFGGGAAPAGAVAIPAGAVGAPPAPGASPPPPPTPAAANTPPPPPAAAAPAGSPPPPPGAPAAAAPPPQAGFAANAGAAAPAGSFVINGVTYIMGSGAQPGLSYQSYLNSNWDHDMMVRGNVIVAIATPAAAPVGAPPPPPPPAAAPPAPAAVNYVPSPTLAAQGHTLDTLRAAAPGKSDAQLAADGWFVVG